MLERSDFVVDIYILPACQGGFKVIPAGTQTNTSTITESVFEHLNDDSLVLAYLGSPGRMEGEDKWFWNPNVMLEAGYRMGLKKPIIFLRDHKRGEDEPLLPFDLSNLQVIELPAEQDDKIKLHRDKTIAQIKQFVDAHELAIKLAHDREECTKEHTVFAWPTITIAFKGGSGEVKCASDDATTLLGFTGDQSLAGMRLTTLLDHVYSRMIPVQREAFSVEQGRMIGEIVIGRKPVTSVCLVFGDGDKDIPGRIEAAHLPIIARLATQSETTMLDVIYLDVTEIAHLDDDGVVRCTFGAKRH
jgi:hypothetical protein